MCRSRRIHGIQQNDRQDRPSQLASAADPARSDGLGPDDPLVRTCERQLRRAGLPLLIEDYSATEDIFTRASPFFALVVLLEFFGAINLDWSPAANVLAVIGGVAVVVGAYGLANMVRGRPFRALPTRVTNHELALFVTLPSLLPLMFGGQVESALATAIVNLVLVGLAWLVVGFGLFSILRWAGTQLFGQLGASLTLLARALPLILFFGLLAFINAEVWQIFATVPVVRYVLASAMFVIVGMVFLLVRLPNEVAGIESDLDLAGSPLRRSQRLNLGLVVLVSQILQVLLVTALVWVFFAVSGALLVDPSVAEAWVGEPAEVLFTLTLPGGTDIPVTRELLKAAFGVAAFSGLYYTVAMLVDATYRDEFMTELTDRIRSTFETRREYLSLLGMATEAET